MSIYQIGKIRKIKNGYIYIQVDGKLKPEHHHIVEVYLNRPLKKKEVIHHINGDKKDNRIINLMLFKTQAEHKSFENKVKQFGYTNPIKTMILNRWKNI